LLVCYRLTGVLFFPIKIPIDKSEFATLIAVALLGISEWATWYSFFQNCRCFAKIVAIVPKSLVFS
jgi:hypothetical protein